jgi:hypothetical protein
MAIPVKGRQIEVGRPERGCERVRTSEMRFVVLGASIFVSGSLYPYVFVKRELVPLMMGMMSSYGETRDFRLLSEPVRDSPRSGFRQQ